MKLGDLQCIDHEYKSSGHDYIVGRTTSNKSLQRFIVFPDTSMTRNEWTIIESSYGRTPAVLSQQNKIAGQGFLRILYQIIQERSSSD